MPLISISIGLLALGICYLISPPTALAALKSIRKMSGNSIPLMISGLIFAGLALSIIPKDLVSKWVGQESGLVGLIAATVLGAVMPGVTSVQFVLMGSLIEAGVGIGPVVAYFTSYALLSVNRLIQWEIPALSGKVALTRFLVSLFFPLLMGWLCQWLAVHYGWEVKS
jgi:uncharacterized protein